MERVLKRVGLSKRTRPETKIQNPMNSDGSFKVQRRRRSKSRRRTNPEGKKTRGLFNIDWESVKDCKSCKSRAITRRLCSKRCDNELYRSNSFKFERFVRGNEETSTLGKQVIFQLFNIVKCFYILIIVYINSRYMYFDLERVEIKNKHNPSGFLRTYSSNLPIPLIHRKCQSSINQSFIN